MITMRKISSYQAEHNIITDQISSHTETELAHTTFSNNVNNSTFIFFNLKKDVVPECLMLSGQQREMVC